MPLRTSVAATDVDLHVPKSLFRMSALNFIVLLTSCCHTDTAMAVN